MVEKGAFRMHWSAMMVLAATVVVAAMVLWPVHTSDRESPRTLCGHNLTLLANALLKRADANGGVIPEDLDLSLHGRGWRILSQDLHRALSPRCPLASEREMTGYQFNQRLRGKHLAKVRPETWLLADSLPRHEGLYMVVTVGGRVYSSQRL